LRAAVSTWAFVFDKYAMMSLIAVENLLLMN
jgi:hypothetical protein